jgi:hypothetical protein
MRAAYTIFPHSGYVLETFRGAVTYPDLVRFTARQQRDLRILNRYHTVSDFVQATLHLTEAEVRQYGEAIYGSSAARAGKRAMVVFGARNLAVVSMLEALAAEYEIPNQCFRYRDAAFRWLEGQQHNVAEGIGQANVTRPYLVPTGMEASAIP